MTITQANGNRLNEPAKHETDIMGIVKVQAPAIWLLNHPEALGYAWLRPALGNELILIGGVDVYLADGRVILEYGSTSEKIVDPDFEIAVSKTLFNEIEAESANA